MVLVIVAAWIGFAHVTQRSTTRRMIDLALDIADGVLDDEPLGAFQDHWLPRYEGALRAVGLVPTRGQWAIVFATVREHVVAHAYSQSKFSLTSSIAATDGVLARLRIEEERVAS